ncbi:N-acetylmuramoyl-L-alanine amidase [Candidatus Omnitrophota bacterium]
MRITVIILIVIAFTVILPVLIAAQIKAIDENQPQHQSAIVNKELTVNLTALKKKESSKSLKISAETAADSLLYSGYAITDTIHVPIAFPEPFLAVTARWSAPGLTESPVTVAINSSENGLLWNGWLDIPVDYHTSDEPGSFMGEILFLDKRTAYIQYRVTKNKSLSNTMQFPETITFAFISPGATSEENRQSFLNMYGGAKKTAAWGEKPPVVSRTDWDCPDGQQSRWSPAYKKVTHLVVHHTAGLNSSADFAAVVRSIWSGHTITRGWGDIGYNYLIDPNGVIYEGRAGGEDAIGAHFSGHNSGSMGVSIMGTYITVEPKQSALTSLDDILSWKCGYSGIDPLGISLHASSGLTLNNICGHRDGRGSTECPGQSLYNLLPTIREKLAIGSPLASPALISPEYFERNQTSPVEFTWNEVEGATEYRLYVADTESGWQGLEGFEAESIVYQSDALPAVSTTYIWNPDDSEIFKPAATYYWTVQSVGENGPGFTASPYKFISGLHTPEIDGPEMVHTENGAVVRFNWSEVDRASHYRIMVSTSDVGFDIDNGFPDTVLDIEFRHPGYDWNDAEEGVRYYWAVKASHTAGFVSNYSDIHSFVARDGIVGVDAEKPLLFKLAQNHPNPFNPLTIIDFTLEHEARVRLNVFNASGQIVATLVNGSLSGGSHTVVWNASGQSSGVYFYRIETDGFSETKRMLLLK